MTETGKSFWQTTTGMITAVAALITALGGIVGILLQNDIIGGNTDARPAEAVTRGGGGNNQPSPEETPGPTDTSSLIPWDRATARLVRKDGTSGTVKAATVVMACTAGVLQFKNGQHFSLQLVRSIQFDAIFIDNHSADGVVTLLDGRQLTDPIHTWNCPVSGTNELGRLDIRLEDIKRVEFHR